MYYEGKELQSENKLLNKNVKEIWVGVIIFTETGTSSNSPPRTVTMEILYIGLLTDK